MVGVVVGLLLPPRVRLAVIVLGVVVAVAEIVRLNIELRQLRATMRELRRFDLEEDDEP